VAWDVTRQIENDDVIPTRVVKLSSLSSSGKEKRNGVVGIGACGGANPANFVSGDKGDRTE